MSCQFSDFSYQSYQGEGMGPMVLMGHPETNL